MTTSSAPHWDVAAYALGVMDARDTALFEDHLAECVSCALELESLLPVTSLLAEVDRDSFLNAEQSEREGRMLDEMVNVVSFDRSRAQARRLLAVAAGTVVMVIAVGLALFAGSQWGQGSTPVAAPSPTVSSGPPGIGGPEGATPDEIFEATDPSSHVKANLGLTAADWGTSVALQLSGVQGPLNCQLVAVGPNVNEPVVSTWTVPPNGYGTQKNPDPLFLQGSTSVQRKDIQRFEVQSLSATGEPTVLVTVNV
jgi:Putative zinc-finger